MVYRYRLYSDRTERFTGTDYSDRELRGLQVQTLF